MGSIVISLLLLVLSNFFILLFLKPHVGLLFLFPRIFCMKRASDRSEARVIRIGLHGLSSE